MFNTLRLLDVINIVTFPTGRAGRPGFDTYGVAVVMTSNQEKSYYDNVEFNPDVVESHLLHNLTEGRVSIKYF